MEGIKTKTKFGKLNFFNDEPLKMWLIPEIYGWILTLLGFGFFIMLVVVGVVNLINSGFSLDALFSILNLVEGIAIGGGFIAFGTTLRRFVVVQATFCVILVLILIFSSYIFLTMGSSDYAIGSLVVISLVTIPLAFSVFMNRDRLMTKYEPAQSEIETNFYEFKTMIDEQTYQSIVALCNEGEAFFADGDYPHAIEKYNNAMKLVPKPIEEHDAATWIQAAIGDCYFAEANYAESAMVLSKTQFNKKAENNPFIELRLGQSFFELSEFDTAANFLTRAYMLGGAEIFDGENQKYFDFLKTRIRPLLNGKW